MTVITLSDMKKALRMTVGKKGMDEENVNKVARYIMGYFGYSDHVVDNRLSSSERDIFYMLEEEGILGTYQEKVRLIQGKMWRLHYWTLNKYKIRKLVEEHDMDEKEEEEEKGSVYDDPDLWNRAEEKND